MPPIRLKPAILIVFLGLFGCGSSGVGTDGDLVGGPCSANGDCVDRCINDPDFPSGTCTLSCVDDGDCPDGTLCVDEAGGTCLLQCDLASDCRIGYRCDTKDRRALPGEVLVCAD